MRSSLPSMGASSSTCPERVLNRRTGIGVAGRRLIFRVKNRGLGGLSDYNSEDYGWGSGYFCGGNCDLDFVVCLVQGGLWLSDIRWKITYIYFAIRIPATLSNFPAATCATPQRGASIRSATGFLYS